MSLIPTIYQSTDPGAPQLSGTVGSLIALLRAVLVNVRHGAVKQGGSTITQQLAKNLFLTPDKTA